MSASSRSASTSSARRRPASSRRSTAAYLIIVTQLPPGAALARTDEVNRRAVEIALKTPGISSAVNIVGFSGATFTNAPNSGAIFVVLELVREARPATRRSRPTASSASSTAGCPSIQEALIFVVAPPPVQGIGNAGGFRMMVEDRAGRGSEALQGAAFAMMGAAAKDPELTQVFSFFETSTPQLYLDIDRTKAQMLGVARARRLRRAADLYRLVLRQRLQPVRPHLSRDRAGRQRLPARSRATCSTSACATTRARPCRSASFTTVRDMSGPVSRAALQSLSRGRARRRRRARLFARAGDRGHGADRRAQRCPTASPIEWTTLAYQQIQAGNTAIFAFVLAVVFVFLVLAAQYESLTLPLAVILIVPMCLVASIVGVVLRGQDNNILTQVGFVVLIGLAAKNAILIVEFAKQLEDQGRDSLRGRGRGGAAAACARS